MIKEKIQSSINVKKAILEDEALLDTLAEVSERIVRCYKAGGKVLFCGNGGSAADAQHLAAELSGRFYFDRTPLPAEAVHVNTSFLTAVSNDYNFEKAYARYIESAGQKGDVLIAISTSGNSQNIIQAMQQARELGMHVVAMTGKTGGKMKGHADQLLNVPSKDTPRIQEAHILMGHIFCEIIEKELFG